jgi:hypothetical protein
MNLEISVLQAIDPEISLQEWELPKKAQVLWKRSIRGTIQSPASNAAESTQ